MRIEKKVIANLTKCYSIAPLTLHGEEHFLVAAEKTDECLLFDLDGNQTDVIWHEPGGTMSMVQVPGSDGQFLATQKFYSPNDSMEAKIVIVTPQTDGSWEIRTLVELPFVHRFDVVTCEGIHYLIACTIKSGHAYKEDWTSPGKIYVAKLPEDLGEYSKEHQLELSVLKEGLTRNHGYYKMEINGIPTCIISAENGVFQLTPPHKEQTDWNIKELLNQPASDAVLVDFDQDGELELGVIAPFHGGNIMIFKETQGIYKKVYEYEKEALFSHAIYGGMLCGTPSLVIGHRQGERNLMVFTYDKEKADYTVTIIDRDCGPANVYHFVTAGVEKMVATNREIDEVALYEWKEEKDERVSLCHK
ncbi:MAG: hypothetical protein PWP24_1766 [Clostridiales bacterium]|nr:hypothetical protein [Clostridiales bacterium]